MIKIPLLTANKISNETYVLFSTTLHYFGKFENKKCNNYKQVINHKNKSDIQQLLIPFSNSILAESVNSLPAYMLEDVHTTHQLHY